MIDTDKYENHEMIRIAKQLLIEDAPLLLEEVKRLREVNDDLICDFEGLQEAVKEDEAGYKDLVASLEGIEEELKAEVKRLREQQQKILRIAETNMALEWGDTNHSFEWGYIIDMIKGWTE